jgi:two-component system, sensor histidine kinase
MSNSTISVVSSHHSPSCSHRPGDDDECRVLVVEDHSDTAALLVMTVEKEGHQVQATRNGTEALVVAVTFQPHIALIDIGLPGLDGLHVTRELRKFLPEILIVAITGRSEPQDVERSRAVGCNHHLIKPFDFNHLLVLLRDWKARGGCHN